MIVYKTTCLVNGKIYIGKACGSRIIKNYLGSGTYIKRAINKYGKENFIRTIIDSTDNRKDQNLKEIFWINFYGSRNPEVGYNITLGGDGGSFSSLFSEETRQKMSESAKERCKNSKHNVSMYGKHHTEETKRKMRVSHVGKNTWTRGMKHSEDIKQKISVGMKKYLNEKKHNSVS